MSDNCVVASNQMEQPRIEYATTEDLLQYVVDSL